MSAWVQTISAVVAGGVLTTGGQLVLEWRRSARDDRRAESGRNEVTRQAARLVLLDALKLLSMLASTRETRRWWTALRLPVAAWRQYSEHLAASLGDQEFRDVGAVFAIAESFNEMMRAAHRYWLVSPFVSLQSGSGPARMRDELVSGSAHAMQTLLPLALPTVDKTDPLYKLAERELPAALPQ